MVLNNMEPEYPKFIITLRNTPINNVEKFKYLGAFIKHDQLSTGDVELNYRIQITLCYRTLKSICELVYLSSIVSFEVD